VNDDTIEVPLPEGTHPDPESVITQEIPVLDPFPDVRLVSPVRVDIPSRSVRVQTLPPRLLGDPILTMAEPVADETSLYDQVHPPAPEPAPKHARRQMRTGDKFLLCLTVAAVGMGTVTYGMIVYGWGAGPVPEPEARPTHRAVITEEEPTVLPTTGESTRRPQVRVVSEPTAYDPTNVASVTVVDPRMTPPPVEAPSAPVAPVRTSEAPEPSPTPTESSTPPPSPSPPPVESEPPLPTDTNTPDPEPSTPTDPPSDTPSPLLPPITASSTPEETFSG
jgi:hypothetical protein